jgi:hypothetical protein
MHDVQMSFMKDEPRPAFILDDVKGAIMYDVQAQIALGSSTIVLKNSRDIDLEKVKGVKDVIIKNTEKKNL